MVAAARHRPGSRAAQASACGPPPDQPTVTNRGAPISSRTAATSSVTSTTRRPGRGVESPYPGRAQMTRRSPRAAAASAIGVYATGPTGVPLCRTRGSPFAGPTARTSSRRPSARYTVNVSAVIPGTYPAHAQGPGADARDPGISVNSAGQMLCFHLTLKFLPWLRDDTASLGRPELLVMTILIALAWPIAAPFALALLKRTVPKLASGSTRPPPVDGASAMTSAEEFLAPRSDLWTVWLQCRVLSVMTRVYLLPRVWVTEALMWSPGRTRLEKFTGNAGNISYHAKYLGLLPWQSTSVPVCSTVLLLALAPSMPTQKLENLA